MGNWRRVHIVGSVEPKDVVSLLLVIDLSDPRRLEYVDFHCLAHTAGLGSLPMWALPDINARGNLAERNYTVQDVADTLEMLAGHAPTLDVKAHVGDAYESEECVATVVLKDGQVEIRDPEVEQVLAPPDSQLLDHFMTQMERRRGGRWIDPNDSPDMLPNEGISSVDG